MEYPLYIVDAFTREPFAGNPCAVVPDAEGLDQRRMQAIAREMNLSETAFVQPSGRADFRVRFFTPAKEIPLAGHPTIATMHLLAELGRIPLREGPVRVTQELAAGVLPVDLQRIEDGTVRVTMTQARPRLFDALAGDAFAAALGLVPGDLRPDVPVQLVSTGTRQVMVPLRSPGALRRCTPDYPRLAALEGRHDFFGTHVFVLEGLRPGHRAHSRHFVAGGGTFEDPVTGSATGGMAAYLWRHGLVREPRYEVGQGDLLGRPGTVGVEVDAEGDEPREVRVSGTAVTVLRGTISA